MKSITSNLATKDLRFDWRIVIITVVSTLLIMADRYHDFLSSSQFDGVVIYLFIPLGIILIFFRESPRDYGFSLGDWRVGIPLTFGALLLLTPIIYFAARSPEMAKYYAASMPGLPWNTFLDLIGWEFTFRGWILFGYARKFGPDALWLQAVPFALAHLGKPELETLTTIFGGFAFGWLAWRTRSFLYPFMIHWYIASLTIIVAARTLA